MFAKALLVDVCTRCLLLSCYLGGCCKKRAELPHLSLHWETEEWRCTELFISLWDLISYISYILYILYLIYLISYILYECRVMCNDKQCVHGGANCTIMWRKQAIYLVMTKWAADENVCTSCLLLGCFAATEKEQICHICNCIWKLNNITLTLASSAIWCKHQFLIKRVKYGQACDECHTV